MNFKSLWSKVVAWVKSHSLSASNNFHSPLLNEHGLIHQHSDTASQPADDAAYAVVKKTESERIQSMEKLQEGFSQLIHQLRGINDHLNRQTAHNEEVLKHLETMPRLVETFPQVVENQKALTEELLKQLNKSSLKNQQFIEAVEKIPLETSKQTDALIDINAQLAATGDIDVQMSQGFNKFNDSLSKLNQKTDSNIESIDKMTKTFATSDRYMKYLMTRQSKQFRWLFIITVFVCMVTILTLAGIVVYLGK